MVDEELRNSLRQRLRMLLAGQATAGQFDDAFYFRYCSTDDRGVREIAVLSHSLFARDEQSPNRSEPVIKSQAIQGLLSRSILFLQTELEFEWPAESLMPGRRAVAGLAIFLALPVVMAVVAIRLPINVVAAQSFMFGFSLLSVATMLHSLRFIAMKPSPVPLRSKKMKNRGDYDVWPFFRRGDHVLARNARSTGD